jgi:hypothetical protein
VEAPGSVVVLGNVPPSATIAAAGDVCVFGRCAEAATAVFHLHASQPPLPPLTDAALGYISRPPVLCCAVYRLAGHVHAGCSGDRSAVISALELRGAQLIIAQCSSLGAARVSNVLGSLSGAQLPGRQQHPP